MKTHFHQRNRLNKDYFGRTIVVLVLFFACAVVFSFMDGVLVRIASPIWKGENALANSFWGFSNFFKSKETLIAENQSLKDKIISQELSIESARVTMQREDDLLRSFGRPKNEIFIAASVLVRPPETPYDILLVDAGADEGVNVSDRVTLAEGIPIGSVVEVFKKTSRVKLYSASGEDTQAVLERGPVSILLTGRGGSSFEFTVPRELEVLIGDRVLSSTINSTLLGTVEDIEVAPTDSLKKVLVSSFVNVHNIRFVRITP
ncbi:MAG: hypothetical protein AB200_00630 [Parcubacteria bacterium C7867-005]|nr:MAG: hypothetical protein AB200_00630 [Parcubacteria bacterium C7867-005]